MECTFITTQQSSSACNQLRTACLKNPATSVRFHVHIQQQNHGLNENLLLGFLKGICLVCVNYLSLSIGIIKKNKTQTQYSKQRNILL